MKSFWGFEIPFAATPRLLRAGAKQFFFRRRAKVLANYSGLFLMAAVSAFYPFANRQHGGLFTAALFAAIGIGASPIVEAAVRDLLRRRLGTAFCVSLALGSAFAIGEYWVALNVALFAFMTTAVEDWTSERGRELLFAGFGLPPAETVAESTLRSLMFERSTATWLQHFFVYIAIAAAAIMLLTTGEVRSAVSVLIVGSASALTASMCLLAFASASHALSHGLRIRDEKVMERLATVDIAVLDEFAENGLSTMTDFSNCAGADSHDKARRAIQLLREMKVETVLFTRALQPVAEVVRQRLGVNLIEAELFPDDKPCKITGLQRKHRKVVFLASETTAASSLATADVSIVTGFESNRMESAADALFLSNDLSDFAEIVRIARRANRIAAISFAIAVIVTSACLGLAIQGKISPQWAIAVRFALEVALMFSAAQLLTPLWKPRTLVVKS